MATHDYEISDGGGAAVINDINDVLQAILSNNSKTTEPATTLPGMLWYDTTLNRLKLRNSGDSGWVSMFDDNGLNCAAATTSGNLSVGGDGSIDGEFQVGTGTVFNAAWDAFGNNINHIGARPRIVLDGTTDSAYVLIDNGATANERVFAILNVASEVTLSRWNDAGTVRYDFISCDQNSGNVRMDNLPTSSVGLAAGTLWNNSGSVDII